MELRAGRTLGLVRTFFFTFFFLIGRPARFFFGLRGGAAAFRFFFAAICVPLRLLRLRLAHYATGCPPSAE